MLYERNDPIFERQEMAEASLAKICHEEKVQKEKKDKTKFLMTPKLDVTFEEYNAENFKYKFKMDSYLLEHMIDSISENESASLAINKQVSKVYNLARSIYENVNLKPETIILGRDSKGQQLSLKSPESELEKIAKDIFTEHVSKEYFRMNKKDRLIKYGDRIQTILSENIEEESFSEKEIPNKIETVYKFILVESLLNKVIFPFTTKAKIKHIIENEKYVKYFDYDSINDLMYECQDEIKKLANMIAIFI